MDLGLPRPSSEGVFDLVWSKGVLRSLWGVTDLGKMMMRITMIGIVMIILKNLVEDGSLITMFRL